MSILQIDVVIVNYVRQADSIKEIKKFIKSKKVKRPVILSGICTEECLENIDDIIKVQTCCNLIKFKYVQFH